MVNVTGAAVDGARGAMVPFSVAVRTPSLKLSTARVSVPVRARVAGLGWSVLSVVVNVAVMGQAGVAARVRVLVPAFEPIPMQAAVPVGAAGGAMVTLDVKRHVPLAFVPSTTTS